MTDSLIGNPTAYKNKESFAGLREAKQRQRDQPPPQMSAVSAPATSSTTRKRPADSNDSYAPSNQNVMPISMVTPYINK